MNMQKSGAWSTHSLAQQTLQLSTATAQERGSMEGEKRAESEPSPRFRAIDCLLFLPLREFIEPF